MEQKDDNFLFGKATIEIDEPLEPRESVEKDLSTTRNGIWKI